MSTESRASHVPWPPPGLEPLHGKLEPIVTLLGLADLLLVLPLLAAVGTAGHFWSTGPFGGAWWMPLLTTVIGIVILSGAMVSLTRLFRLAAGGAVQGHGWRGIVLVACDDTRDTGFVLQGGRAFAGVASTRRDRILVTRLVAAGGMVAAGILMPAGFALSVVLGRLGLAGLGLFWTLSFWIPLLCLVAGLGARFADRLLTASAYRDQARRQAAEAEIRSEVGEWSWRLGQARPSTAMRLGNVGRTGAFRAGAWIVPAIALAVIVPVTFLSVAGFVGSVLAQMGAPALPGGRGRMAAIEVLRRQRLEFDPKVSPDSAGAALHALFAVGADNDSLAPSLLKPVRAYPIAWWPQDQARGTVLKTVQEAESLFAHLGRFNSAERAYVVRVAAHPAHREFATLARARSVDVIGQRWTLPFPDSLTTFDLPVPHFSEARNAARAHVARAALDLAEGRWQVAEHEVREVISLGFALIDNAPTMIEALIGGAIVRFGGDALVAVYRRTGRAHDAEVLHWVLTDLRAAAARGNVSQAQSVDDAYRTMAEVVSDSATPRGIRWESFLMVSTFAPCMSLNRIVFGPGKEFVAWRAEARKSLVHSPGEEALFALSSRGILGTSGCLPGWKLLGLIRENY